MSLGRFFNPLASRRVGVLSGLALAALGLACSFLGEPASYPPAATLTPAAAEPTATEPPEPTVATGTSSPPGVEVVCNGVRFLADPSVASGASCETIPAVPESGDVAPWDVAPEHTRITLQGYTLAETFHMPRLFVYPVEEFQAMSERAAQVVSDLGSVLAARPTTPEGGIPFLPAFNAAQILRTQVRFLDFANGAGVRFLTLYGQSYLVVSNHELFYTFQSISDDGAFYVAAVLPVSHPSLPAMGDVPPEDFDTFADNFQTYVAEVELQLEAQPPETFAPQLTLLDALIGSLEVP